MIPTIRYPRRAASALRHQTISIPLTALHQPEIPSPSSSAGTLCRPRRWWRSGAEHGRFRVATVSRAGLHIDPVTPSEEMDGILQVQLLTALDTCMLANAA